MARPVEQIEAEILDLPTQERARLAQMPLSSLDEDAEVERAWSEEMARRVEGLRSGKVKVVPAKQAPEVVWSRRR